MNRSKSELEELRDSVDALVTEIMMYSGWMPESVLKAAQKCTGNRVRIINSMHHPLCDCDSCMELFVKGKIKKEKERALLDAIKNYLGSN